MEKEILQNFNLYERIIIRIHKRLFIKVYKQGITFGFNNK